MQRASSGGAEVPAKTPQMFMTRAILGSIVVPCRFSRSVTCGTRAWTQQPSDDAAIMQNVWSRVAQTRLSCRCPSCLHTATGVARRAATAPGKRPSRYAYSSTLFYSGIFAAAATTDAGIKQRRRDQWNRAIADVKQDLAEEETAPTELVNAQEETATTVYDGASVVEQETDLAPESTTESTLWRPIEVDNDEALYEPGHTHTHAAWPANTGLRPVPYNLPPQSKYATNHARSKDANRRWTPKKIRSTELAVDKMILRLILYMDDKECRRWTAQTVPEPFAELLSMPRSRLESLLGETQTQLDAVKKADPWLHDLEHFERLPYATQYHQDDDGYFHGTASDLRGAIQDLFQKRTSGQLPYSHMLAKICYNLSISSAPPNLQCWNTILQSFIGLGRNDHPVFITIRAIREANVRMNEDTMITVLNYYTSANHSHRFTWFVGLMRGQGTGLSLARPDININEVGASRLIRVEDPETGITKVIQKPHPTPGVFEALINGVLHFAGFEAALRVCQDMGNEGWGLGMRGMTPLLRDCVTRGDWDSGQEVWAQIKLIQEKSRRDGRPERIQFQTYVEGLRLFAFSKQEDLFHTTFDEALKASHPQRKLLQALKESRRDGEEEVKEEISREHLLGDFEGTVELDEYEVGERPMTLSG